MIVYRYLTSNELYNILYRAKHEIGEKPTEVQLASSRKYRRGVKYLHFFKSLDDLPVVQKLDKSPDGRFVGKFDIPMRDMLGGHGVGKYSGTPIENSDKFVAMKEFAVELWHVKPNTLVDYIFDEKCDMLVDEVREQFEEQAREPSEE